MTSQPRMPAATSALRPPPSPNQAPYGYTVVLERAKPNGGMSPELEEVTLRRKGSDATARRAAALTPGFRRVVSVTPIAAEEAPPPRKCRAPVVGTATGEAGLSLEQIDAAADAVRAVKQAAEELAVIAARKRTLLRATEGNLESIERLLPEAAGTMSGVLKLKARCAHLHELINIEELESWKITVDQVMDAAWRRLP